MSQLDIPPEFRPPAAKLPEHYRLRATYHPDLFPTPYHTIRRAVADRDDFAPRLPARGWFRYPELPPVKLRGLSPTDSLILRAAIAERMLYPAEVGLAAVVPYTPPEPAATPIPVSRDLLTCPDAPGQVDGWIPWPEPPTREPSDEEPGYPLEWPDHQEKVIPGPERASDWPELPRARLPGRVWLIEIKPNAGYVALGQVLTYTWNWNRHYGARWPAEPAILTDLPRPYLVDMAPDFGIHIISLGRLIVEPPPYPT